MLIKATLSNTRHPEYGEVTIPLPIKTSEYDRTMEMLANLEIGDVMGRDCKIMELSSPYSILQKLEGSEVNIDELDYLAKRLESFEADQDLQFQAAAFARGVASIEDFINLTFCSDQATVIYDFTKLEEAGRQHFMNLHGGCASTEELENLDGYETALLLIDGGGAEITPYGVLYDNGMQMEQLYKGGPFPPYLYDAYELVLPVSPTQSPQNKTYLYLPSSNLQLERTLLRGGIMEREGWFHKLEPIQLSSVITAKLDTRRDSIRELNEMCRSIHLLILKGFLSVCLFTTVPVRLYTLSVSLQGTFSAGLTGYGSSIGTIGEGILDDLSSVESITEMAGESLSFGLSVITSPITSPSAKARVIDTGLLGRPSEPQLASLRHGSSTPGRISVGRPPCLSLGLDGSIIVPDGIIAIQLATGCFMDGWTRLAPYLAVVDRGYIRQTDITEQIL